MKVTKKKLATTLDFFISYGMFLYAMQAVLLLANLAFNNIYNKRLVRRLHNPKMKLPLKITKF